MPSVRKAFLLVLTTVCWFPTIAFSEPPSMQPLVDRQALPAALHGVSLPSAEMVTAEQAARVRGGWVMTMSLPYFATQIEGRGPFRLDIWTISGGANAGTPMYIRVMIR